jgi:tetratricopeptide (TPR) repeat protein
MIRARIFGALLALVSWSAGCATQDPAQAGAAEAQRHLDDGKESVRSGWTLEGIDHFTAAVKANPDLAEAWFWRGKCEIQMRLDPKWEGDLRLMEQHALDDFSMAIRKNPAYGDAYYNRAMVLSSRAQFKLAVDDLLNAVRYKPQDPEPHLWLGELYEKKFEDRAPMAMDHYEKYADLGGTEPTAREKARLWKELRKQIAAPSPEPTTNRAPTPEEERKAQELHAKGLELLKNPDKAEAVHTFEQLLSTYGHTKYVQGKLQALQAVVAAFKKKDAPK